MVEHPKSMSSQPRSQTTVVTLYDRMMILNWMDPLPISLLKMIHSLQRSNRGVDDLLDQGQAMLETLRDQRETYLKGFQRKMKDIAATVGMSTTVMGLVQRRQEGDKYVLFGGMVATCIVMLLVYKFLT